MSYEFNDSGFIYPFYINEDESDSEYGDMDSAKLPEGTAANNANTNHTSDDGLTFGRIRMEKVCGQWVTKEESEGTIVPRKTEASPDPKYPFAIVHYYKVDQLTSIKIHAWGEFLLSAFQHVMKAVRNINWSFKPVKVRCSFILSFTCPRLMSTHTENIRPT